MALHGPWQFDVVAELRGDKGGANEQKNELRRIEMGFNLWGPLSTRSNIAIIPGLDEPLMPQRTQMLIELIE